LIRLWNKVIWWWIWTEWCRWVAVKVDKVNSKSCNTVIHKRLALMEKQSVKPTKLKQKEQLGLMEKKSQRDNKCTTILPPATRKWLMNVC
jgi:hypothetical protein